MFSEGSHGPIETESTERGRNCQVHITFLRHSNKATFDPHTESGISLSNLSVKGKERAKALGNQLETSGTVIGQISPMERSKETMSSIEEGLSTQDDAPQLLSHRLNYELDGAHFSPSFIKEYRAHFTKMPDDYNSLPPDEQEKIIEDAEKPAVAWWLSHWSKNNEDSPYDENTESPEEVAQRIAWRVKMFIDNTANMPSNTKEDLLAITHRTATEPFLLCCLEPPINSIEDIGGALDLLQGWELLVTTDATGNVQHSLVINNKEYKLNQEMVARLARQYETTNNYLEKYHGDKPDISF